MYKKLFIIKLQIYLFEMKHIVNMFETKKNLYFRTVERSDFISAISSDKEQNEILLSLFFLLVTR